jgi:VanZ family protein
LLLPAPELLRLKLWVVRWWPWMLDLSRANDAPGADKWVHGGLFAVLGLLGALAWRGMRARPALLLGLVVLGALTEWLQAYVPGRSMSAADWVADSAGALLGLGLGWLWARQLNKP